MKFSNTHWALALILSGALFAVQAQAAIGKSGLPKEPEWQAGNKTGRSGKSASFGSA